MLIVLLRSGAVPRANVNQTSKFCGVAGTLCRAINRSAWPAIELAYSESTSTIGTRSIGRSMFSNVTLSWDRDTEAESHANARARSLTRRTLPRKNEDL